MRVNIAEIAEIFGVSRPTITAWTNDGMPYAVAGSKGKPWEYETGDCLAWWAENKFRRRANSLPEGDPFREPGDGRETYDEAERREKVAKADRAELALAKDAGRVAIIEDVAAVVTEMNVRVRSRLLGIPNKVRMHARSMLAGNRELEEQVVTTVEEVVNEAIAEIRDDPFAQGGEPEEV